MTTSAPLQDQQGEAAINASRRFSPGPVITALVIANVVEGIVLGTGVSVTPALGVLFHQTAGALNWVSTIQLISAGICVLIFSRLGDMFGHRRMLRIALIVSLVGAILCVVAPTFGVLLLGRALEGPIATFTPLAVAIMRGRLNQKRSRRGISLLAAGILIGSLLGLLLTTVVFNATSSARAVLVIPVVFFVISLVMAFFFVPESTTRAGKRLDWPGIVLLTLSVGLILLALAEGNTWGWGSPATLTVLPVGVVLLVVWIIVETRTAEPLINIRNTVGRSTGPIYLASFFYGCALFGSQTAFTTFLATNPHVGYGFGLTASQLAIVALPGVVLSIVGAIVTPPLTRWLGRKGVLVAGFTLTVIGYAVLVLDHTTIAAMVIGLLISQFGLGVTSAAIPIVISENANRAGVGIATGIFNFTKSFGGSLAGAVFALLLTDIVIMGSGIPTAGAYALVWGVCGGSAVVAGVLIAVLARTSKAGLDEAEVAA